MLNMKARTAVQSSLSRGFIAKLRSKIPKLSTNKLSESISKHEKSIKLMNAYNNLVGKLSSIEKLYRVSIDKINNINEDVSDNNNARSIFNNFLKCLLNEFKIYKVQKANLKNKISEINEELSTAKKDVKDKKIKKDINKLSSNLTELERHLNKIKDQSKAIKQSFSTKYGVLPIHTLNNALYHEKNDGGVIGILMQVHDFLVSSKYSKELVKKFQDMLDKDFIYELNKIKSVSNFKEEGNPNILLDENISIEIDNAYAELNKLISELKNETTTALNSLKQETNLNNFINSTKKFNVSNKVNEFVDGKYYKNVPKKFDESMKAFCMLAYLNRASEELLPILLEDMPKQNG